MFAQPPFVYIRRCHAGWHAPARSTGLSEHCLCQSATTANIVELWICADRLSFPTADLVSVVHVKVKLWIPCEVPLDNGKETW